MIFNKSVREREVCALRSLDIHLCRAWYAEPWCEEGTVLKAVGRIGEGQATSCQRLLSVATEHLATLQRWNK